MDKVPSCSKEQRVSVGTWSTNVARWEVGGEGGDGRREVEERREKGERCEEEERKSKETTHLLLVPGVLVPSVGHHDVQGILQLGDGNENLLDL